MTDENAAVTFLAPDHPALTTPNKITTADFEGWVQERGIYYPDQWDDHFTPILACSDPGEAPLKGGLLVAKYGRGHFVYTGPRLLPATSRGGARRLPALRQPGLARQMIPPTTPSAPPTSRPPARQKRATWRPDCRGLRAGPAFTRSWSAVSSRAWCCWSC